MSTGNQALWDATSKRKRFVMVDAAAYSYFLRLVFLPHGDII